MNEPVVGVQIIGVHGCSSLDEIKAWLTEDREKEFMAAMSAFLSEEGDKAVLGQIGGAYDGRWIFWHRRAE